MREMRSGILATQAVILTLCAARAGTDWLCGHATVEGAIALVLLVAFTMWFAAEATGRAEPHPAPLPGGMPYRSPMPRGAPPQQESL